MVAPLGDRFEWTWGYHHYALGGRGYYFYGVPKREVFRNAERGIHQAAEVGDDARRALAAGRSGCRASSTR